MSIMETFVTKLRKDGQDHVRVSAIGETAIGRLCAHDWRRRFYIPRVGDFLSPVCFANWLVTGDEAARHDPRYRVKQNVRGYHRYVLYAKYHQLCSLRSVLQREMLDLPFVCYKIHQSGIKEFDRWKEYPGTVKEMVQFVIDPENGPKKLFPFPPELVEEINSMIEAIAQASSPEEESCDQQKIEEDTVAQTQQATEEPQTVTE